MPGGPLAHTTLLCSSAILLDWGSQQKLGILLAQARVFQASRCALSGAPLELPAVHFFCGHSFNGAVKCKTI